MYIDVPFLLKFLISKPLFFVFILNSIFHFFQECLLNFLNLIDMTLISIYRNWDKFLFLFLPILFWFFFSNDSSCKSKYINIVTRIFIIQSVFFNPKTHFFCWFLVLIFFWFLLEFEFPIILSIFYYWDYFSIIDLNLLTY